MKRPTIAIAKHQMTGLYDGGYVDSWSRVGVRLVGGGLLHWRDLLTPEQVLDQLSEADKYAMEVTALNNEVEAMKRKLFEPKPAQPPAYAVDKLVVKELLLEGDMMVPGNLTILPQECPPAELTDEQLHQAIYPLLMELNNRVARRGDYTLCAFIGGLGNALDVYHNNEEDTDNAATSS